MNRRRWICGDVWMDILPSFDHAQLGLKMALLSDRFDVLVDKHFDGKTTELTIWREIIIDKNIGPKAKLFVVIDGKFVDFPFPDNPLPNKICFKNLQIQSVLTFVYALHNADALDNLRRRTSPSILTDLDQLVSIDSGDLLPDGIADDGPNGNAGQALTKWLHTPTKNGQPKELHRNNYVGPLNLEWVNNFKETFLRATASVGYKIRFVSYQIQLYLRVETMPIEPFELVNEVTNEKLTLKQEIEASSNGIIYNWLLQRCPIGETATAPVKFELRYDNNSSANLNNILFDLWSGNDPIGPLSPPAEEEKEEEDKADQSNGNVV